MAEINDVLEIVQFIKDTAASKTDLAALEFRIDQKLETEIGSVRKDMKEMESRLIEHIDGLTKLTEKFDHELTALRDKVDRHDELFSKLFKRLELDPRSL